MSKGSKESNANNIADILQNLGAMQGTLNSSTSFVDSMRKISAIPGISSLSPALISQIGNISAMQGTLNSSTSFVDNMKKISTIPGISSLPPALISQIGNISAMQETLNLSTSFVDSMRKISAQRNEIAKAALKIPNYSQIVSLVLNELSAEHLSLNETVKTLSALGAPLESAITPDADDEIEYEDNEFTKYWFAIYEHIIKAYNVVNSSLVGTALRDLISILSLIITMQGGQAPQINLYNFTDSNIEVNIIGDKMDVIITDPEELNSKKEDDGGEEDLEVILNPGIRS